MGVLTETPITQKTCIACGQVKPVGDFYQSRTGRDRKMRRHARCKNCESKDKQEWKKKNVSGWDLKVAHLRNTYGMSEAEYFAVIEDQAGGCAICAAKLDPRTRFAHVDHCHETGRIRGILCHNCNTGLGGFRDSVALLAAAMEYLSRDPLPFIHKMNRPKKMRGGWGGWGAINRGKRRPKSEVGA